MVFAAAYPVASTGQELDRIIVRAPQGENDASYNYYMQLLQFALDFTADQYGEVTIETYPTLLTQRREIELLKENKYLTLSWFGESAERRSELGVIDVPLLNGTLGYRVPVIHRDNLEKFRSISDADELKHLEACQGASWPDSDILEHNGYSVIRVPTFPAMYKMLMHKRCDYFPRAITEGYSEVESIDSEDVMVFEDILLVYPFHMKFFTSKENKLLIKRLWEGLITAKATGRIDELLKTHPSTSSFYPMARYQDSMVFALENPGWPD